MDIDQLVEEIMDAFESEPEADYGDRRVDHWVRTQGIKAKIHDILSDVLEEDLPSRLSSEEDYD